jgi:hypothetical protein
MAGGVYGTGINAPPAVLANTMQAITQKAIEPVLADNVMNPSSTFWALCRKGKVFKGGELIYPLLFVEELTGGAYVGAQLLNTTVTDSIQSANQVWRDYYEAISIPVTDVIRNAGSGLDIIQMKVEAASSSFLQKLSRALWHTTPQNTANDIDDIESWIGSGTPAAPTGTGIATNVIAGIDRSVAANSFWQPPTPQSTTATAITALIMDTAYATVKLGYDEPDLILSDRTRYVNFKANFMGAGTSYMARYGDNMQDREAIQSGFRYHFLFNSAVVLDDPFIAANIFYILNTKYIHPVFHPGSYFRLTPWLRPTNQDVITAQMFLTWQLECLAPRMGIKVLSS